MDVFSQTTIRESTEVPKRCFLPASHCHWAAVADETRNSEFTNKLTSGKQRYRTLHSTCIPPCFVEAASAKGDLFSQSDNENRPVKTKPKGRRIGCFSPRDNNICCIDATAWIDRLRKLTLVRQSKLQIY